MIRKNFIVYFFILLNLFFYSQLVKIKAQEVNVNALVGSKVVLQYSSATSNVNESLADLSQRALITVKLRDADNEPLKDIPVTVFSNRGDIDWIRASSANGEIIELIDDKPIIKSDENGFVFFRVASKVPGEAHFNVLADNLIEFEPIKIKFLPLPFPTNITVTIEVPSFMSPDNKITIFKPFGHEFDRDKLVNLGVEIIIPFWLAATILLLLTLGPILFFIIFLLILRVKKYEKANNLCLEKEERAIEQQGLEIKKEQVEIEKEIRLLKEIVDKKTDKN